MRLVSLAQRALIGYLALALIAGNARAGADTVATVRHFEIQPQAASLGLKEFARQADISLVFSSTLVANRQTGSLRGNFTVAEGLRRLLEGSGLSFRQVSATTIAINAASATREHPDPESQAHGSPAQDESPPKRNTNMSHRGFFTRMASLLALSSAALGSGHAYAQGTTDTNQPANADASAANTNNLEEVVVTGTATAGGVKKLDASFEITTASLEEIRDTQPSSAADMLKIVPGVWAESSGGEAGANIELAGFPGGGDSPYITYQINGSPVFPASGGISFMDNSSLFRIDESIERAEVLQGGPGVVFSNGQLGATANFILRQGTADPHGDIGLTVGTDHGYRVDGFYGGPLTQDWFVSFGGFYRYSEGVRNAQFPADNGGQLTGTLAHKWDSGNILFYARVLNDKNLFITDIPVTVTGDGKSQTVSAFPGFNPNTGTFAGSGLRGISVQEAPGAAPLTADLADGRGANLHMFGNDLDVQINDIVSFNNRMMYVGGESDCFCLFNNFAPQTLGSFIQQQETTVNGNGAITRPYGVATAYDATLVSTGAAVNPSSYVASLGFWIVQKQIQSFTDDMRFSFDLFPGNTLTAGGYLAVYSSDDHWWLGNNELVTATPNAQLIDLTLNNGVNVTNDAGLLGGSFFTLNEHWNGLNTAFFLSDSWKTGPWLFDAGYRIEEQKDHGTIENDSLVDLDNDPRNLYNKQVSVPNGTFNQGVSCESSGTNECTEFAHTLGSWALGANYEITPHMAVFGRVNQGVHFPGFDDLRSGQPETQKIDNYEIGYRAQTQTMYGVVDVFRRKFTGVPYQQFTATGNQVTGIYGASSYGLNVEGLWQPLEALSIAISGDWQHAVYTSFSSVTAGGANYTGLTLQRQPRLQFRVTPAYQIPLDFGSLRFFATYTHVGLRYSDIANQQILPEYYTLDAGGVAEIGHNFEVRLQGTNLTNQLGLTEGNARIALGSGSGIANNFEMVRPIFGREVTLQLRYKF
jgi:TonB dependent receptor-like, beta-barrel/TonB-dependent Receptor Plug Domain/Secretin and TonB N terminus short domain